MKKNNIYLATKLYSFFDRKTSVVMYNSVLNSKKFSDDNIYLTFKNSNIETGEIGLPTTEKLILPCGIYGKITKN